MTMALLKGFHLSAKGQEDLTHEFHAQPLGIYFWSPIFSSSRVLSLFFFLVLTHSFSPTHDDNCAELKSHLQFLNIIALDANFVFNMSIISI